MMKKICSLLRVGLLASIFLLLVTQLHADTTKFDAIFFKPAIGRNTFLMLEDSKTLQQFQFQFNTYGSYGYHPLQITTGATRVQGVIDHLAVIDYVLAFGITKWFQMGVDFPMVVINKFQDPNTVPGTGTKNYFDLGDLRVGAKFRILDPCESPVGLAIAPFITVPTGNTTHYVGSTGITGGGRVILEGKFFNRIHLVGNLGYLVGKKANIRNIEFQNRLLFGAGMAYQFRPSFAFFGEINGDSAFERFWKDKERNPMEAMVGARWNVKESGFEVSAGGGTCIVCGVKGARARAVLGLGYRLSTQKYKDAEYETYNTCYSSEVSWLNPVALFDLELNCPRNPNDFNPEKDDISCPKYYELQTYADLVVRCPQSPEDFNPSVHDPACEKIFNLSALLSEDERANVYILALSEMEQRCPANPANFNPQIHDMGCPKFYTFAAAWKDIKNCPPPGKYVAGKDNADCQKIYDFVGDMPASQWRAILAYLKRDSDHDGINDLQDMCPAEPETYNNFLDEDGCPEFRYVAIFGGEIMTARPIEFAFNSSRLTEPDKRTIEDIVAYINGNSNVKSVRIAGHADDIGSWHANELISKKRAMAVINEMKKQGLRKNISLMPIAYGYSRPIAPNTSEENRAKNRRVVFNVVFPN